MLVLSRKLSQQIHIDDRITVTVLRVKGNSVRLGIEAPRDVRVVRGELKPFDHEVQEQKAVPRLQRIASIGPRPEIRDEQDRRQKVDPTPSHTDRWTVANMRERTRSLKEHRPSTLQHRVDRVRGKMNSVMG